MPAIVFLLLARACIFVPGLDSLGKFRGAAHKLKLASTCILGVGHACISVLAQALVANTP